MTQENSTESVASTQNTESTEAQSPVQEIEGLNTQVTDNKIYRISQEANEPEAERPEGLPEKFKDNQALLDAYNSLEKKFSSTRRAEVPENYEFNINEDFKEKWNIPQDDPMMNSFKAYARENKFDQDQFNSAVNFYIKNAVDNTELVSVQLEAEREAVLKEVGYNTTPEIAQKELKTWLLNNTSTANENDIDSILQDPSAIKIIAMLKNNTNHGVPIVSNHVVAKDMQFFIDKKADPRYIRDKGFTNKVDAEFADAVKRGWV